MKFPCFVRVLSTIAAAVLNADFASSESNWDCDERCPNYDECRDGGARRNLESNLSLSEDMDDLLTENGESDSSNALGLRGGGKQQQQQHRKLENRHFHLKMYHEESEDYCWQGEWEDR